MSRTNIRQIEAFNAVMKGGSITKGAETLFVSQPAVSKLIRAFEDACGFPLFTRGAGKLMPTAEARRMFIETEKLQAGVARIENTARAIQRLERGDVSVVAFPALSLRVLPKYAARFLEGRPEVTLNLLTRNSPSIVDSMLTREADFGVSLISSHDPGILCSPFAELSMVCALPANHPLAKKKRIKLEELKNDKLIMLGRADQSHGVVLEAFSIAGLQVEQLIEAQMADAACSLVAEGCGVALVPSLISIGWRQDEVVFLPIEPAIKLTMWLYTSAYEPTQNLALHLLKVLRSGVQEIERSFSVPAPRNKR